MANAAAFQPGDVLLFTSDNSHIDHIICLLTKSDVAHSAIFYGQDRFGNDLLVDAATRCGIAGHQVQVLSPGQTPPGGPTSPPWAERDIYVHRLKTPPPLPPGLPSELLGAAKTYAGQNNPFNFEGLIQLGLHLLFREGPRPLLILRLIGELFEMLASELSMFTGHKPGTGPNPMYCSQFVCQCFTDAGCPLHIAKPAKTLAPSTMLDWIVRGSASFAPAPGSARAPRPGNRTIDDVLAELDDALSSEVKSPDRSFAAAPGNPPPELIQATNEFGEALQRLLEPDGSKAMLAGLSYLRKLQDNYVTPADLRQHCSDLKDIGGTYRIRRNADVSPLP